MFRQCEGIIVGAGIGGLCTAIALKEKGIPVQVFEAADRLEAVGAGILVPPNAMSVLSHYGLAEAVMEQGHSVDSLSVLDYRSQLLAKNDATYANAGKNLKTVAIHRSKLQQILIDALGKDAIFTGHRCINVCNTDWGVDVAFSNGTQVSAKFLVGADGLHSRVRAALFGEYSLRYSGQICWRGVANFQLDDDLRDQVSELWGLGIRFGFVQIAPSKVYWFATKKRKLQIDAVKTTKEDLQELYKDFAAPVQALIENTSETDILEGYIRDLPSLKNWSSRSTVLVGDAAHAMTPNIGQGGAQAIEDSFALAQAIRNNYSLPHAFEQFQTMRTQKVNQIVKASWQLGRMTNVSYPWLCYTRNSLIRAFAPMMADKQNQTFYQWP